jgi:hypothetical protein
MTGRVHVVVHTAERALPALAAAEEWHNAGRAHHVLEPALGGILARRYGAVGCMPR